MLLSQHANGNDSKIVVCTKDYGKNLLATIIMILNV